MQANSTEIFVEETRKHQNDQTEECELSVQEHVLNSKMFFHLSWRGSLDGTITLSKK